MQNQNLTNIFKAYDVRGIYPDQLDEKTAYQVGEAYAAIRKPKRLAVGRDVRSSGDSLKKHLISALLKCGIDVVDIGVITTDQLYFAVGNYGYDGGISVTASHNPAEYNGFKFSDTSGAPIDSETLIAMRDWIASGNRSTDKTIGKLSKNEILDDYVNSVLKFVDNSQIGTFSIVANANFGAVGRSIDKISSKLGLKLERMNWQEDGTFPKGPPNPLLPDNRSETILTIRAKHPDIGVAWDADADRVFFFTGDGLFIPSCYIVALLSKEFLDKYPGSNIVHDITTAWVIDDTIRAAGGMPITNRTGHTFIKARMRQEDSPFGGESSGHFYFRDSFYADNGIVPLLMILQMMTRTGKSLKELVEPLMSKYKVSGELNYEVENPIKAIELIETSFSKEGAVDKLDGLVVANDNWRFSVRPSNTEPLFRFNAEAKSQGQLDAIVKRVSELINKQT